jgi:flagellar biosynthesis protein FlhF
MKVKKIIAPTMAEAMKKVSEELGQDAVILNSRVVREGGVFGFFSKKKFEVIAALDQFPKTIKPLNKTSPEQKSEEVNISSKEFVPFSFEQPINKEQTNLKPSKQEDQSHLLGEMKELKSMLTVLQKQQTGEEILPPQLESIKDHLIEQDVLPSIIEKLLCELKPRLALQSNQVSDEQIHKWMKDLFLDLISPFEYGHRHDEIKYVNVVGPTGVGKTTTLAKIAAEAVLKYRKKVAFITTDTYRIAAIDQLKTYATILDVPIEVCYNLEDFKAAKQKFTHYDLVLIDTSGRNFRDSKYVEELKEILDFNELETYLVLAVTSKYKDMRKIYDQFHTIPIKKVVFSKIDETESYGSILNFIVEKQIGVAYLTNGQNVPDDIVEGSPSQIFSILSKEARL